ncbi:MAG: ParB/RepB/Spo0J family partition protein [Coriobacteriales bacterium]|jgi:ParB family chromosome partitioning protein|nr:ParB/RepB/Spo0J family partition protein [Coriobacteriales bacterium]
MKPTIKTVKIADLYPFEKSPFGLRNMDELASSIGEAGVYVPLVARLREAGGYEIIDGHRRRAAAEASGIDAVPVLVVEMDDDQAAIALVDTNLMCRESVLPSERGFAYKLKLDALSHQGIRTCGTEFHKSRDEIAEGMTGRQVSKYIRLTELIAPLLQMVDDGSIALSPAVELSYLTEDEQLALFGACMDAMATPSHAQAIRLRDSSRTGQFTKDIPVAVMAEDKPNQKDQLKLPMDEVSRFFPKSYTPRQMQETIVKLLEQWQRKRERDKGAR